MRKLNLIKIFVFIYKCKNAIAAIQSTYNSEKTNNINKEKYCYITSDASPIEYSEHIDTDQFDINKEIIIAETMNPSVYEDSPEIMSREDPFYNYIIALQKSDAFKEETKPMQESLEEIKDTDATDETPILPEENESINITEEISNIVIEEYHESTTVNDETCRVAYEIANEIPIHDDIIEKLSLIYFKFSLKNYQKENGNGFNKLFIHFPETLALLYLIIKNNKSNEHIINVFNTFLKLNTQNRFKKSDGIKNIYSKKIYIRQELLKILKTELSSLTNHVLLYEKLAQLEELAFRTQQSTGKLSLTHLKTISSLFNIILFIRDETALQLKEKIESLIFYLHHNDIGTFKENLNFNEINLEILFDSIAMIKDIYDYTLPSKASCYKKRCRFNKYLSSKIKKMQTQINEDIDILKILRKLESYKKTFKTFTIKNSYYPFMHFFHSFFDSVVESR